MRNLVWVLAMLLSLFSAECGEKQGDLIIIVVTPTKAWGPFSENLYFFDKNDAESLGLIGSNLGKKKSKAIHLGKDELREIGKSVPFSTQNGDIDFVLHGFIKSELSIDHICSNLNKSDFIEFLNANSEIFGKIDYIQKLISFHEKRNEH